MTIRKRITPNSVKPLSQKNLRRIHRAVGIASKVTKYILESIDEEDIETVKENPSVSLELLLEKIPDSVRKVAREEMKKERAERERIPSPIRDAVLKRDHYQCVICGEKEPLELHHYIYVSHGGQNTTGNLVTLCANHHRQVHYHGLKIKKPRSVRVLK